MMSDGYFQSLLLRISSLAAIILMALAAGFALHAIWQFIVNPAITIWEWWPYAKPAAFFGAWCVLLLGCIQGVVQ